MVFFKCEAIRADKVDREQLRSEAETLPNELAELTMNLYQDSNGESMVFTASVGIGYATFGVLAPTPDEAEKQAHAYLHWLPFLVEDYTLEEITFATMLKLMGLAQPAAMDGESLIK